MFKLNDCKWPLSCWENGCLSSSASLFTCTLLVCQEQELQGCSLSPCDSCFMGGKENGNVISPPTEQHSLPCSCHVTGVTRKIRIPWPDAVPAPCWKPVDGFSKSVLFWKAGRFCPLWLKFIAWHFLRVQTWERLFHSVCSAAVFCAHQGLWLFDDSLSNTQTGTHSHNTFTHTLTHIHTHQHSYFSFRVLPGWLSTACLHHLNISCFASWNLTFLYMKPTPFPNTDK